MSISRPKASRIELWSTNKERSSYEQLSNIFAIIRATEDLESSYEKGVIPQVDYERECEKLINQFKVSENAGIIQGDVFFREQGLGAEYMRAYERLVRKKEPIKLAQKDVGNQAVEVAHAVQSFITAIDVLALDQKAVDQLQPYISELIVSLRKIRSLSNFDGLVKLDDWLQILSKKKAYDDLSEDDIRQLKFDLDTCYSSFKAQLEKK